MIFSAARLHGHASSRRRPYTGGGRVDNARTWPGLDRLLPRHVIEWAAVWRFALEGDLDKSRKARFVVFNTSSAFSKLEAASARSSLRAGRARRYFLPGRGRPHRAACRGRSPRASPGRTPKPKIGGTGLPMAFDTGNLPVNYAPTAVSLRDWYVFKTCFDVSTFNRENPR